MVIYNFTQRWSVGICIPTPERGNDGVEAIYCELPYNYSK